MPNNGVLLNVSFKGRTNIIQNYVLCLSMSKKVSSNVERVDEISWSYLKQNLSIRIYESSGSTIEYNTFVIFLLMSKCI